MVNQSVKQSQPRRVVVTGLGMLTCLGNDVDTTWKGILEGQSGIRPIDKFDAESFKTKFSGVVRDLDISPYISAKEARNMDEFIQYGLIAGIQAVQDAKLEVQPDQAHRFGVAIGSGIGGISTIESSRDLLRDKGPRRVSPFFVPGSIINMVSGHLSIKFGFKGPNIAVVTACTTGTHNIGLAARLIRSGDADVMLAGGSEMATTPVSVAGFANARALSTYNDSPTQASRPWDKDRDGFVLGDGAGVLVLEEYEHAKSRGAKIYAELAGFGMSSDAHHITSPVESGLGAVQSMRLAIEDSGLSLADISYINAHGTSTVPGDIAETNAVKNIFGTSAYGIPISSTKSMIGHLLGAAGAVEAIFSVLAIRDQIAPPTINLDNPGEHCDLDYVPHNARATKITGVISNSFGFGGTNGSLVFCSV